MPGGGTSGKRGGRAGKSLPVVGGLLGSLGGKKRTGAARGGKPAILGLLGAGAAGAAVLAKRRKGTSSPEVPVDADNAVAHPPAPATPGHGAGGPTSGEQTG